MQKSTPKGQPYAIFDDDFATLIIPTFNGSYSGTYFCGNENNIYKLTAIGSINIFLSVRPGMLQYINYYII